MLEDELREMFAARAQTLPAAADPAGRAIRTARRTTRRRRTATGTMTVFAFATVLGGAVAAQGLGAATTAATDPNRVTFQNLYGADQPVAARQTQLPTMELPVDLLVGQQLWTTDGQRVDLVHEGDVAMIAKVPDGWVYSDANTVRLLPNSASEPLRLSGQAEWAVSHDGSRVATNDQGTMAVTKVSGGDRGTTVASSPVKPETAAPVTFFGERVVVSSEKGFDYWSAAAPSQYTETWNADLLAMFGSLGADVAIGIVRGEGDLLCLVDVTAVSKGLKIGARLGCGDLVGRALVKLHAALSPSGRLLAVATPSGLQMIDLDKSRINAAAGKEKKQTQVEALVLQADCPIAAVEAVVWADERTVLAQTDADGIFACRNDGTKLQVTLPPDVQPGWTMIPSYGAGK
ncbi:hypothetical protein [Catellatospora citrea]|uniref:Uncharacterized protein n=1 Tax=Catellatospora citrea TaxID=53366 RepID=A0A8J3K695_9ACTN|nr:hypothetical protein [Catellatospora citrea]RKE09307.1 hypothetical protein C8E86_4191 [Catellatospora citrea]GIF97262.1 hypothetical protein Cci01nite_23560 [Catellatospora citrea]